MTEQSQTIDYGVVLSSPEERNRVLRNTYWLLALSMLPTVLGAGHCPTSACVRQIGVLD